MTPDQYQEAQDAREAKIDRAVQHGYSTAAAARSIGLDVDALEAFLTGRGRRDLWESLLTADAMPRERPVPERMVPRDMPVTEAERTPDAVDRVLRAVAR